MPASAPLTRRRRPPVLRAAGLVGALAWLAVSPAGAGPGADAEAGAPACPQPRGTPAAPAAYLEKANPLPDTPANRRAGRRLYEADRGPGACRDCHGASGDGLGPAGAGLVPPPRNFRCGETVDGLKDGQLFWVIERGPDGFHEPVLQGAQQVGRPGRRARFTAMSAYGEHLDETEIWQIVLYLRSLSGAATAAAEPGQVQPPGGR